jgi:glycosyltransferase involved in cell wall biosynthesis
MKKVLFVGPIVPPIHGQSLAFTRFYETIDDKNKLLINTNFDDKNKFYKVIFSIWNLFLIALKTLFYSYDVVYFTCSRTFFGSIKDVILINLAKFRCKKIVNHLHGASFYSFLHNSGNLYKNILIQTYSKVDVSIVLTQSMKKQFQDFPNMNITFISNFYDEELANTVYKKNSKSIKLLYLSNIMQQKGIFELIDAFKVLSLKYENITLDIGGGFIADEMSISDVRYKFLKKINGIEKIKYHGIVKGEEKIKLFQQSDIFILPTYYESEAIPISIIEAMATGNAIITTNFNYLPELINMNNGVLVEIKSIDSLMIGIEKLLVNQDLLRSMQKHNSLEAKEKYSYDTYIRKLKKIVLENRIQKLV